MVTDWPEESMMLRKEPITTQLKDLSDELETRSLLFEFKDAQVPDVEKALEAPVCEFVSQVSRGVPARCCAK